ncbi:MAG: tape measure protein [Eubacteriales bacterium]|nr:tape measure protein [Eubacteriales bacterium]
MATLNDSMRNMEGVSDSTWKQVSSDIAGANQQLDDMANKQNSSVPSSTQKVGSSLGALAKRALTTAAALAGPAVVLKKGFSRLTEIDNAKAKLTGLGNSTAKVKTIMQNANAAVKGTAFGMGEAATTAATAVAAGIKPGKQLQNYLSLIGDTATIAGTDMTEMGSIFNKVAANGKVDAEMMNQLTDRGIPAWSLLAKASGKSVAQIRDQVSAGKVDLDLFTKAMDKGMGGAAKKMGTSTFSAAFKNMGAAVGRIGANILDGGGDGGGLFSQMKPTLTAITKSLSGLEKGAANVGKVLGVAFKGIVDGFKIVGSAVRIAMTPFRALAKRISVVSGKNKDFSTMRAVIAGVTTAVTGLVIAYGTFKTVMAVTNGVKRIAGFLDKVAIARSVLKTKATIAEAAATKTAQGAQVGMNAALLASPLTWVVIGIMAIVAVLVVLQKKFNIFGKLKNLFSSFGEKIKSVGGKIKGSFAKIGDSAKKIGTGFKKHFGNAWSTFKGFVKKIGDKCPGLKNFFSGIVMFISGVFTGKWKKAWSGVVKIFKTTFNGIKAAAKAPLNAVIWLVNRAIDGLNKFKVKIPKGVPKIGGKAFGFNISHIPQLAKGTANAAGGLTMVGEQGPELVELPKGSRVNTAGQTRRMETSRTNNITIRNLIGSAQIRSDKDIKDLAYELAKLLTDESGDVPDVV